MKSLSLALDVVRAILSLSNITLTEANRMWPEVEALKEASAKSGTNLRCLMANSVMGCQYWSSKVEKMLNVFEQSKVHLTEFTEGLEALESITDSDLDIGVALAAHFTRLGLCPHAPPGIARGPPFVLPSPRERVALLAARVARRLALPRASSAGAAAIDFGAPASAQDDAHLPSSTSCTS